MSLPTPVAHGQVSPSSACRVLIADDHPIVRTALRCLLETTPTIEVIAEAQDGDEALAKITELQPDVAVVDIAMPKLNGIEIARRSLSARASTRILALTALEDARTLRASLEAGAAGFVPKSAAATDLIAAIHAVATGGCYVHPRLAHELISTRSLSHSDAPGELTAREGQVLRMIALGFSNKEIAAELSLSVKTVETYKVRAMEKIGASSRTHIVRYAVRRGWLAKSEAH